jgi:hypothetical protein
MKKQPSERLQSVISALTDLRNEYRNLQDLQGNLLRRLWDLRNEVHIEASTQEMPDDERALLYSTVRDLEECFDQEAHRQLSVLRKKLVFAQAQSKKRTR